MIAAHRRLEQWLFDSPRWRFGLVLLVLTIVKSGLWYQPNIQSFLTLARNPFVNPFQDPDAHYAVWSWLGSFLAWVGGIDRMGPFLALHLGFAAAFWLLVARLAFARLPDAQARVALIVFSLLPVSATAFFWIGPDGLTLLLLLGALAWPQRPLVVFAVGVLLGMQHAEQAVCAAVALMIALAAPRRPQTGEPVHMRMAVALLLGALAGKLVLMGLFHAWDLQVNSGRWYWVRHHAYHLVHQFYYHSHVVLWSMMGLGWLVALRYAQVAERSIPFFLGLCVVAALLPISGDQTRVAAVVSLPLIHVFWLSNPAFLGSVSRGDATMAFVAWLIVPWTWAWGGLPRVSAFPHDVAWVLNQLFGWFVVPPDPALWPYW